MRRQATFRQILEATADANSRRVSERAMLANRTAKAATRADAKASAYAVKSRALEHGLAKFGARYSLVSLERDGTLAALRHEGGACLHLPVTGCPEPVRGWLDGERARVVAEWRGVAVAA